MTQITNREEKRRYTHTQIEIIDRKEDARVKDCNILLWEEENLSLWPKRNHDVRKTFLIFRGQAFIHRAPPPPIDPVVRHG
jgi:hypothetical protein